MVISDKLVATDATIFELVTLWCQDLGALGSVKQLSNEIESWVVPIVQCAQTLVILFHTLLQSL